MTDVPAPAATLKPRRKIRYRIVLILLIAVAVFLCWFTFTDAAPFPLDTRPVIAYRFAPRLPLQREWERANEPGFLHGWKIEKTIDPVPEDVRKEILSALRSNWSYSLDNYRCFDPGMAFTFGDGPNRVEVLVCLHCRKAYFAKGGQVSQTNLSASGTNKMREVYERLFGPTTRSSSTRE